KGMTTPCPLAVGAHSRTERTAARPASQRACGFTLDPPSAQDMTVMIRLLPYGSAHWPKMTNPSPSPATAADICPVVSWMSTLQARSPSAPLRIILPFAWSTSLIDDSVPCCPAFAWRFLSFLPCASTWKMEGKLTSTAVPRRHRPSAPHSVTAVVPQITGADPSNLPAAPTEG